jgi:hypothetical protein
MKPVLEEPAEERRRGGAVEAIIVIENFDTHSLIRDRWKTIQIDSIRSDLQGGARI